MEENKLLSSARKGTSRAGKTDLINYLLGKRLTQRQAIRAKCYDCNGLGEVDTCDVQDCSLYPYSPYTRKSPRVRPAKLWREKKGIVNDDAERIDNSEKN